ncbi:hypothetical protein XENOCAPTIV_000498, partial [Xenoophorus captivus]
CPPGMKQQVLTFYTKLLAHIRQPLLPHINVHRPVQFLCIVCAKLKQDPYLVNFFLEDGRIVVKACEGLMLLVSLPEPAAARCLTENTDLCELLTDRLVSFYKALPPSMDPLDIETVESVNWGIVRQVTSEALLQEIVYFLLGEDKEAETAAAIVQNPLRHRLIEHCDHLSDEISIMTLRLFEQLIQKPNQHILHSLVLRSLEERNFLENKPQEEREPLENGQPHDAV